MALRRPAAAAPVYGSEALAAADADVADAVVTPIDPGRFELRLRDFKVTELRRLMTACNFWKSGNH